MTTSPTGSAVGRGGRPDDECLPETALRVLTATTQADADTLRGVAEALSHELRTPLTTIYTGSKLLSRSARHASDEVVREVSSAMLADAERLMRIVEDLVVAAALPDTPAVPGEPLLLQHLLPGVARDGVDGSARLVMQIPARLGPVRGEPAFVGQALRNMLANATAYGPADGTVIVEAEKGTDAIEVHVLDEGPGVAPDEVPRLFRLFSRSAIDQLGAWGWGCSSAAGLSS